MNGRPIIAPAELKRTTRDTDAGAAEHWVTPQAYVPTRRHPSSSVGTIIAAALASWATLALIAELALHAIRSAL